MKRSFTLLEVCLGIFLLILAGSFGARKLSKTLEMRRFLSDVEKLKLELVSYQRLAVNMQADWTALLKKEQKGWSFQAKCIEQPSELSFSPLKLSFSHILLEGNTAAPQTLQIDFFSTGVVDPQGTLTLCSGQSKKSLSLSGIFQREESPRCKN